MKDSNTSLFIDEDEQLSSPPHEVFFDDSSGGSVDRDDNKHADEESDDNTLYCLCRKIARGFMVGCDGGCDDWFHGTCVGIKARQKDLLEQFVCPDCTTKGHGVTAWKDTAGGNAGHTTTKQALQAAQDSTVAASNSLLDSSLPPKSSRSGHDHESARSPQPIAATRKHIARSKLRAQSASNRKALAPHPYSGVMKKLRVSLPTFENRTPGFGALSNINDSDAEDAQDNGDDDKHLDDALRATVTPVHKTAVEFQRRTYIDVEEAPTVVDVMVKHALELALFGTQCG
ncbi:uncharacterized protein RCC_00848 [Ramularia collo-cygni]|uniref:PHD-type domain-containing protein n=1 Tax=Ramularia collo-cygni TaxID=112498 RepID=A0A2D3UV99_9PEZI|nr:uncharacterized protein RCC_00848 [Ramularia collo-cygni]CZT14916.1 uncharacterized protein RCC_00848 [Ramularia collo-cygni]